MTHIPNCIHEIKWFFFTCSDASNEPIPLESHITELTELKEQVCFVAPVDHFTVLCSVTQAFEWKQGWRWPCFDTDFSAFVMSMVLVSIRTTWFTQQKQSGLYQNKVTSSLAAIQRPGHWADNCEMACYYMAISHKDWELPNSRIWLAEMDIDRGLDFPSRPVMFWSEKVAK